MSTLTNAVHIVQDTLRVAHGSSPWRSIKLPLSIILAVLVLFSGFLQVHLVGPLLLSVVLSLFAFGRCSRAYRRTASDPIFDSSAICALAKFLIPSGSISGWTKTYLRIAHSAEQLSTGLTGSSLCLKLESVFRDVRQGVVELQDPSNNLTQLVKGQLQSDGWRIKVELSLEDKMKTWAWFIANELSILPDEEFSEPCPFADEGTISSPERAVLKHYCSLFFGKYDDVMVWPSVDTVPRAFIQTFIRATQEKLRIKCQCQKMSVFSFSTSETGLSIFDDAFVYATLSLSRLFSKNSRTSDTKAKHQSQSRFLGPRSSAPLFSSLPSVISLLTSGPQALRVLSLSNGSISYADALDAHARTLEYDENSRHECIRGVGIQGWREERMYARWEAAVYRSGLLTRWVVLLEAKE